MLYDKIFFGLMPSQFNHSLNYWFRQNYQ